MTSHRSGFTPKAKAGKEKDSFVPLFTPNTRDRVAPRVISATNFSTELRKKIGVEPTDPLSSADMFRVIKEYPQIIPFALYDPGFHWNLVTKVLPHGIEIYDPIIGLRTIGVIRESDVTYYFSENGEPRSDINLDKARENGYSLASESLRRLGITRANPADCGPLSIYAALVAKGLVIPTL